MKDVMLEYFLEYELYYIKRISIFNDLINMNIQINIESPLIGNNTDS